MNEKLKNLVKKHKNIVTSYDVVRCSENEYEYDDYKVNLKAELEEIGNEWHIDAKNINWQGRSGSLETNDIDKVVSSTLFHDGQCNTTIWREGDVLEGVCYHHDCPTGSWFTITGIKEDEKV